MTVILSGKQAVFVAEWVANEAKPEAERLPGYQVAVNAGVAPRNAAAYASLALSNPKIIAGIAERKRQLAEDAAPDVDVKRIVREWADIAFADATEAITVRRVNCRHCWGLGHAYQWTDGELARESAEDMQREAFDSSRFIGGGGYRYTRDPNPDCPECCGEGVEDVHVADLRKLRGPVRRLISGVKQGKNGIEILFRDQSEALAKLAQWAGLLVNKNEHSGPGGGPIPTAAVNYTLPSDPAEAARAYQLLMEGKK